MPFTEIYRDIWRLTIPYADGFTNVFLLRSGAASILVDAAACEADVKNDILPALKDLGVRPQYLVCTHRHEDHCGGMAALGQALDDAEILSFSGDLGNGGRIGEGEILLDRFKIIELPGHTDDSIGIFDRQSGVLLTGDSLQQDGISWMGLNLVDAAAYAATVEKLRAMQPHALIASHEFEPHGAIVIGHDQVNACFDTCLASLREMMADLTTYLPCTVDEAIERYNSSHKRKIGDWSMPNFLLYIQGKKA